MVASDNLTGLMKNETLWPINNKDLHIADLKFRGHFHSMGKVMEVRWVLNIKTFEMIILFTKKIFLSFKCIIVINFTQLTFTLWYTAISIFCNMFHVPNELFTVLVSYQIFIQKTWCWQTFSGILLSVISFLW